MGTLNLKHLNTPLFSDMQKYTEFENIQWI